MMRSRNDASVFFVSLGCPKNRVDTERMASILLAQGYRVTGSPDDADVIVVNTSVGATGLETDQCLRRIDQLLERIRGVSGRRGELFFCDPRNQSNKACKRLLKALKPMCQGGKRL